VKVVVQKFGGTCVESEANQLLTAERIMEAKDRGIHPVVVVSAMGRQGQPYSTAEFVSMVRRIHPDIQPRELDLLMSCGEIISTVAMAHLLRSKGYETVALSGGQAGLITDHYFGHAHIVRIEPHHLLAALQDGYMVFVAGFQGITERHEITTLGAGGSDYTAVALTHVIQETPTLPFGEELEVEPLQMFKEVDGIMTANPTTLDQDEDGGPRTIRHLTHDECVAMSRLGSQVLQQQAAEMARKHRSPLIVRNFREAASPGTEVGSQPRTASDRATAIVDRSHLLVFDLASGDARLPQQIEERLGGERLTYYQVHTEAPESRFAVLPLKYRDMAAIVRHVLAARGVSAEINADDFALVSVVGEALRQRLDDWDDQARKVLSDCGAPVQGTSRDAISLSYLVPEDKRREAVKCLHHSLVL
jgi:aspartate kinase